MTWLVAELQIHHKPDDGEDTEAFREFVTSIQTVIQNTPFDVRCEVKELADQGNETQVGSTVGSEEAPDSEVTIHIGRHTHKFSPEKFRKILFSAIIDRRPSPEIVAIVNAMITSLPPAHEV
jgi:hypothetical protein